MFLPSVYEAAGVGLNVTFGRNIAISGDGQLIAVSDDQTAAVYVYQRYRRGYRQEQVRKAYGSTDQHGCGGSD